MVVLAAGEGRRFGATKQLVPLGGRPLVVHAVDGALASGAARVVVVTGHDHDDVAAAVTAHAPDGASPVAEVVRNPDWADGQASSVAAGIRALRDVPDEDPTGGLDVAVVVLGDVPGTRSDTIAAVAAEAAAGHAVGARTRYTDGPGHPVAFTRTVWVRLETLRGDTGARQLRDLDLAEVVVARPRPRDVDVPDDLDRVRGRRPRPDDVGPDGPGSSPD